MYLLGCFLVLGCFSDRLCVCWVVSLVDEMVCVCWDVSRVDEVCVRLFLW